MIAICSHNCIFICNYSSYHFLSLPSNESDITDIKPFLFDYLLSSDQDGAIALWNWKL